MADERAGRVFRFGPFEADENTGELRKHGIRIKLHAQPFQILLLLLEKPNELVTREELRRRLWPGDTFVDFDHSLNAAVNKLRHALGDSAGNPRHVETIPGKGYRFIGTLMNQQVWHEAPVPIPTRSRKVLTEPEELPKAPRALVLILLLLIQAMYLSFYLGALANFYEVNDIVIEARLMSPELLMFVIIGSAAALIPVRLFLAAAVAFNYQQLWLKFSKLWPSLLMVDEVWALSPLLLVHHISLGLALGLSAILVYAPFAQRSLVLMYAQSERMLSVNQS